MRTNSFLKVIMAIVMTFAAMVLSFSLTSCGEKDFLVDGEHTDNPDNPDDPEKPVDPSWYVYGVSKLDCKSTAIEWKSSSNVSLTKAYEDEAQEGYAQATVSHSYTADIEYRDKNNESEYKHSQETESYSTNLFTRLYGLSNVMAFSSYDEMNQANGTITFAQNVTGGKLYTLSFGGSRQVVLKATASTSVSSLSFGGKTVTDLCSATWAEPEYVGKKAVEVASDKKGYDKYQMEVMVRVTVANAGNEDVTRIMHFVVKNVYVRNGEGNPDPLPTPEPEVMGYDVINVDFTNGYTTGTIIKIYDDLSQETVGDFRVALNHKTESPKDVTLTVTSLDWTEGETSSTELAASGESRYVDVAGNCRINIQEVYTSLTNRTNHAAMTFKGYFELPTIQFPDGTSKELAFGEYSLSDRGVEETSSSDMSKTLTHKVGASFNGSSSETLSANVVLNKTNNPNPGENREEGITIENFVPQGNVYTMDVIHYWSNSDPTRESISIVHNGAQNAENEKVTESRNYNTTTPEMVEKSSESYSTTAGTLSVSGSVKTFESNFIFAGANVTVTSKYLSEFTLTSQAGNTASATVKGAAYKKGATMGTQDLGDATMSIFKDQIHFGLMVANVDIANCDQILRYEEEKETPVDPTPEDPTEDIFAKVLENKIEFINSYWTATMKASIKNSRGIERDTTMQVVYTSAGVSFGAIADFISESNSFSFTRFSNGNSTTSNATSGKAQITYNKQSMTAVYDKFNHDVTVTNGSAYIVLAGQKLEFLPTQITVANPTTDQVSTPVVSGEYNSWASSVSYAYGFNGHTDNSKTEFNIKVLKPIDPIIIDADRIIGGAITVTVDANTQPMLSLVIACGNKTIIYNDSYSFKSGKNSVNVNQTPSVKPAMKFNNIPSATLNGVGSDRNPANLIVADGEWAYYAADGYTRLFSASDVLTTGCTNPVIAVGTVENGMLKIKNGDQIMYFSVK